MHIHLCTPEQPLDTTAGILEVYIEALAIGTIANEIITRWNQIWQKMAIVCKYGLKILILTPKDRYNFTTKVCE